MSFKNAEIFEGIFSKQTLSSTWCQQKKYSGENLTLRDAWLALLNGRIVSDPHATENQRWGLDTYYPRCTE